MADEIREEEIDLEYNHMLGVRTRHTRYFTLNLRTALILIGMFSIAAWGGVFALGFGFGVSLCGH